VHHIVLEDYIATVEAAKARRDRLTAQIEAMLPDWTLAPVVAALQTMRGMALVNAATLIAELGDLSRFANPRQLMAYLGLVPSEHSSGASVRRGGLTKAGNSAARRLLIEAAWCYRFPARVSRELLLRQEEQPKPIREIAWKAQLRLCTRYRKLARSGKPANVVTAAIARELAMVSRWKGKGDHATLLKEEASFLKKHGAISIRCGHCLPVRMRVNSSVLRLSPIG